MPQNFSNNVPEVMWRKKGENNSENASQKNLNFAGKEKLPHLSDSFVEPV